MSRHSSKPGTVHRSHHHQQQQHHQQQHQQQQPRSIIKHKSPGVIDHGSFHNDSNDDDEDEDDNKNNMVHSTALHHSGPSFTPTGSSSRSKSKQGVSFMRTVPSFSSGSSGSSGSSQPLQGHPIRGGSSHGASSSGSSSSSGNGSGSGSGNAGVTSLFGGFMGGRTMETLTVSTSPATSGSHSAGHLHSSSGSGTTTSTGAIAGTPATSSARHSFSSSALPKVAPGTLTGTSIPSSRSGTTGSVDAEKIQQLEATVATLEEKVKSLTSLLDSLIAVEEVSSVVGDATDAAGVAGAGASSSSGATVETGIKVTIRGNEFFLWNGLKGDKGERGERGEKGERGERGEKGEEGKIVEVVRFMTPPPVITSISKATGSATEVLTISGENFNRSSLVLWGEGKELKPVDVTSTQLKIRIPYLARPGPTIISVSNDNFLTSNGVEFHQHH